MAIDQSEERLVIQDLTRDLKLQFTGPSEGVTGMLSTTLGKIARLLGAAVPSLEIPSQGFLAEPLTEDQRIVVDQNLGPIYAKKGLAYQDKTRSVTIQECGEPMVDLQTALTQRRIDATFNSNPYPFQCGDAPRMFWAREGSIEPVLNMAEALNHVGLQAHFLDVYRSAGVQEGLYRWVYQNIRRLYPQLDLAGALRETDSKVGSYPAISAHKAGAAFDILIQKPNGTFLNLGNGYPDPGAAVALEFPFITEEQFITRALFRHTAEMAGLVTYPFEDWHCSIGDLGGTASQNGSVAKYGPIHGFDHTTGEIDPYEQAQLFQRFPHE